MDILDVNDLYSKQEVCCTQSSNINKIPTDTTKKFIEIENEW